MALRDEHADILGGPILQRPESGLFSMFSRYHFVFKSVVLLGLGLLVWIVGARGLEHLRKHRELRHRKAMRRKHGIPDSDCRPFAVAYAAAKRAHLEREAQDRKKMTNYVSDYNLPAVDQRTDAQKDARGLRRRVPANAVQSRDDPLHGKHATAYSDKRLETHSLDFVNRYNPNPRYQVTIPEPLLVERYSVRRTSRKDLIINIDSNEESRKRSFEEESDGEYETMKKSRIDRDDLKGEEKRADWDAQYDDVTSRWASRESSSRQPRSNHVYANGRQRYDCADGSQDEDHEPIDEEMEDINEHGAAELKAVARGKKRDRAEAGSSFGGDEEDIRSGRVSRSRKRRSVLRRRLDLPARGQKRNREAESLDSDGEEGDSETSRRRAQRTSKKKKGKKAASDALSTSVEDPHISKDPHCSGRKVGDEWEVDGVRYKVADNGERLRLTLVKKARNKYHMPQDSQHPDRSAALEIYVETWLTDEQYKCAEERQELAWQEVPRELSGSKTPDVVGSPMKNGKSLLWDSVKYSPTRRPFRQLVPTGALTRINPFEQLQPALARRVASSSAIASPILSGVADSPTRPGFRGFSKWEKQDREADALARIRAKIEDEKKVQALAQKLVEIHSSASAPELGTKPLSVPTITLTPAPVVAADEHAIKIPQCKPNTLTSLSTNDSIKGAVAPAATGSSQPSTSTPALTPSTLFPSAPTAHTTTSSTPSPSFSFGNPLQVPLTTPVASSSSTVPNPFGKGSGGGTPSMPTFSPSTLSATSQPQPPSSNTSKPQPSSFSKPATFSFSPPAAAAASPGTKSQLPDVSAPSPSPAISTPAITKPDVPVPPTNAPEISKPTIPPFSFSGAPSSTTTFQAPSTPKFAFGQPSTTSTFTPASNLASGAPSQPKLTFKFGQALSGPKGGDSATVVPAADEAKKSPALVSVFGAAASSSEPIKPSLFETSAFGTLSSASTTSFSAKPVAADSSAPTSTLSKPGSASGIATANNIVSPAAPASGNIPAFTFGGTNSGFKTGEVSKPASLFGGATGLAPMFGASSAEKKPTFTFTAPTEGTKSIPIFGGNVDGMKPPVFGSAGSSSR